MSGTTSSTSSISSYFSSSPTTLNSETDLFIPKTHSVTGTAKTNFFSKVSEVAKESWNSYQRFLASPRETFLNSMRNVAKGATGIDLAKYCECMKPNQKEIEIFLGKVEILEKALNEQKDVRKDRLQEMYGDDPKWEREKKRSTNELNQKFETILSIKQTLTEYLKDQNKSEYCVLYPGDKERIYDGDQFAQAIKSTGEVGNLISEYITQYNLNNYLSTFDHKGILKDSTQSLNHKYSIGRNYV